MNYSKSSFKQRGVTLFVGMILLVLITLMVTTAFSLSHSNLKSVGNMQLREEAISAANKAIEQVISSPFTNNPTAEEINVDVNNDGNVDYVVSIAKPICIRATLDQSATVSSIELPLMSTVSNWNTLWQIDATINDNKTGAKVSVSAGTRVLLTDAKKNSVCI